MRKRTLLYPFLAAFTYIAITGNAGGPAHFNTGKDFTGRLGADGSCSMSGCHNNGGSIPSPTGMIELRKKKWGGQSAPVTYYEAGETYFVTIVGTGQTNHFGFQLVAIQAPNTRVGLFSAFPANAHGYPQATPALAEHNAPIAKNGIGEYKVNFEWTAPNPGVGAITFYGIINAVNNNGVISGDKPSNTLSLSLADKTSVGQVTKEVVFKAYPNPVQNILTLDLTKADAGTYTVQAYTTSGSLVTQTEIEIDSRVYTGVINTADWKPGLYFVRIQKDGDTRVIPILKQ